MVVPIDQIPLREEEFGLALEVWPLVFIFILVNELCFKNE